MARYRARQSLRPINRVKHVVDNSATVAGGSGFLQELISTVDAPVLASTNQVQTACTVNAIYLKVVVASNEAQDVGAIPNVYMYVAKNPGNNLSLPSANTVGTSDNKKFVIHQEMSMIDNKLGGQPTVLHNGVIVIPKGYRRFGPDDALVINFVSPALNTALCYQCHYKEFR